MTGYGIIYEMKKSRTSTKKLFIVRKYIMAKSAKEAIRLDKTAPVDDCWVDEQYKTASINMGFNTTNKI